MMTQVVTVLAHIIYSSPIQGCFSSLWEIFFISFSAHLNVLPQAAQAVNCLNGELQGKA